MRPDPIARDIAASTRWLSIVGVGEDGVDGLTRLARERIGGAAVVFGGKRHLALVAPLIKGEARPWPPQFAGAVDEVVAQRGRAVCVLASGDPFMYGVGSVLARRVDPNETVAIPAPSAFSLAAARLGWALPETVTVSLHGKALDLVRPHLQPGARVLALTSDADGPAALARLLTQAGFGGSRLTVLEALGGPRERVRAAIAADFTIEHVDPLNLAAIDVVAGADARVLPRAPGLDDRLFEHDGQISKRHVRALTLAALAPRRGERLWDIGAGSGSVAIEWMLADPSLRAVAVEERADRAARIARNAAAFGVPGLAVVNGRAPEALAGLSSPEAVFVGGGATGEVLDRAGRALPSGGRLVANAVTLETQSLLVARHAALGGDLIRIAIEHAAPLGGFETWRPALPVVQWTWVKP